METRVLLRTSVGVRLCKGWWLWKSHASDQNKPSHTLWSSNVPLLRVVLAPRVLLHHFRWGCLALVHAGPCGHVCTLLNKVPPARAAMKHLLSLPLAPALPRGRESGHRDTQMCQKALSHFHLVQTSSSSTSLLGREQKGCIQHASRETHLCTHGTLLIQISLLTPK